MDDKNKKYLTIGIVAIVVIAAVGIGAYYLTKDDKKSGDLTVNFLVEDNEGVYFWVQGTTSSDGTVMDAWENAVDSYGFLSSFEKSTSTEGDGIESLFGLEMKQISESKWNWWSQFTWNNNAWTVSNKMMSTIQASDCKYFGMIYGDGTNTLSADPNDYKVLSSELSGYKFLIESSSGLYFEVSADGDNAYDAITDICDIYFIPYTVVESWGYVSSMFDLGWDDVAQKYWSLSVYENDNWTISSDGLLNITSTSNFIGLYYSTGGIITVDP